MLHNFNTVYSLSESLYGTDLTTSSLEDIALNGWERIGAKHTRLYKYTNDTINCSLKLPCNVDVIESVHVQQEDFQISSNLSENMNAFNTETMIESTKIDFNPLYNSGRLIKYREANNILYFSRDYTNVTVIYHGIIVDDDEGLPLINDKEINAIAAFIAYSNLYKNAIIQKDRNLLELAQIAKRDWLKFCNAARIPQHLSQNDMNTILDAKVRWDRKQFGKSMKPLL